MAQGWQRAVVMSACALLLSCGGDDSNEVVAGQPEPGSPIAVDEVLSGGTPGAATTSNGLFLYDSQLLAGPRLGRGEVVGDSVMILPGGSVLDVAEPFDYPFEIRSTVASLGSEVFLLGERCAEIVGSDDTTYCEPGGFQVAVLSTESGQWRTIDVPDQLQASVDHGIPWITSLVGVTPDGMVVMYLAPEGNPEVGAAPIWGFDLSTERWHHFPDPGVDVFDYCLAGDHLVASAGDEHLGVDPGITGLSVLLLPADGSTEDWAAPFPAIDQAWGYTYLGCTDGMAVVWGDAQFGGGLDDQPAYRLLLRSQAEWEQIEPLPGDFEVRHALSAGGRLVLFGDHGAPLVLDESTWRALEAPAWSLDATQVWDGERVIIVDPEAREPITTVELPE